MYWGHLFSSTMRHLGWLTEGRHDPHYHRQKAWAAVEAHLCLRVAVAVVARHFQALEVVAVVASCRYFALAAEAAVGRFLYHLVEAVAVVVSQQQSVVVAVVVLWHLLLVAAAEVSQ